MLEELSNHRTSITLYILIGEPGSGKGTTGKAAMELIGEDPTFVYRVMSDILKKRSQTSDPLGKMIADQMGSGELVDDEPTMQALEQQIVTDIRNGVRKFILDGAPRNLLQGKAIIKSGVPFFVFHLTVSKETAIKRIQERARREKRVDDSPEIMTKRMNNDRTKEVAKLLKGHCPKRFTSIDDELPTKKRVATLLKTMGFEGRVLHEMMAKFDRDIHSGQKPYQTPKNPDRPHRSSARSLKTRSTYKNRLRRVPLFRIPRPIQRQFAASS